MEETSVGVTNLLQKLGPSSGCPSLWLYWTSNPFPCGTRAVSSISPHSICTGQENMAHLFSHHSEASASLQFLFFPGANRGERNPLLPAKPSSFSICPSLPELRLLSLHSKTFLLPLQARLYMPKNPICTLFSALKKSILEVTKDVLWAKKKINKS